MDIDIKRYFIQWIEQYLFFPNIFQRVISICFFPITIVYCIVVAYERTKANPFDFGIKVVSVGNLIIGGSGKTPVTIALAKEYKNVAIILRGYGRTSKGLYVISKNGKILEDIDISGDEARVFANSLPNATVIVSENRVNAIIKAKEMRCEMVFLDDGYSQHHIKKFDILIRPKIEPTNPFCIPSGGYRETKMMYSFVPVVLKDEVDFKRKIEFKQNNNILKELPKNIVLVTAISKPNRLFEYLPKNIKYEFFADHHNFTQEDIEMLLKKYPNYNFIVTSKDLVKLEKFNLSNLILMDLTINITKKINFS